MQGVLEPADLSNDFAKSPRASKRRRLNVNYAPKPLHDHDQDLEPVQDLALETEPKEVKPDTARIKRSAELASDVRVPGFIRPKSEYYSLRPGPCVTEDEALKALLPADHCRDDEDYMIIVEDYHIYECDESSLSGKYRPLNDLKNKIGCSALRFDAQLRTERHQCRVEGIAFETLAVDGYDVEDDTVTDKIYIQTPLAAKRNVWYILRRPAAAYASYHHDFLWLADFTKHFIAFLQYSGKVCLRDFQFEFARWIHDQSQYSEIVRTWLVRSPGDDYRKHVAAFVEYLWKEATDPGTDPTNSNWEHPIWCEVDYNQLRAIKERKYPKDAKTIVTPYVKQCFDVFYFSDQLEARVPSAPNFNGHKSKWADRLSWTSKHVGQGTGQHDIAARRVKIGDVVEVSADEDGHWNTSSPSWLAYVQAIKIERNGQVRLDVLWLYGSEDTLCASSHYPYPTERFLSDNCNCEATAKERLYAHHILGFPNVSFFQNDPVTNRHFVRQRYYTEGETNAFETLKETHFTCRHRQSSAQASMKIGETLLVRLSGSTRLEPCVLESQVDSEEVQVRLLQRRLMYDSGASVNELLWTEESAAIKREDIVRKCHVRNYTHSEVRKRNVPPPYCYDGTADCWILSGRLRGNTVVDLGNYHPSSFREGFNSTTLPESVEKMRSLSIFCGADGLARGIEEAGAAESYAAVDIDGSAIHTRLANSNDDPDSYFWGSAVHYQALAMEGRYSRAIAVIGTIQLLLAGSPCQGVSLKNNNKMSERSKRNTSMAALVVSFIELYRPNYAIFENVLGLAHEIEKNGGQTVFAQIMAALVGLGYQVRSFHCNAVNSGSGSLRSRIIVSVAAPGLVPIDPRCATHLLPVSARSRAICKTANGLPFGFNEITEAPFPFVNARAATQGLPSVMPPSGICPSNADHRVSAGLQQHWEDIIRLVPRFPYGQGFVAAKAKDLIPQELLDRALGGGYQGSVWSNPKTNKALRRVDPDLPFDTILTKCQPLDARGGRSLHWTEHRQLTIAEARRAQSVPDHEVLIGRPSQQWKLVGNGVDRKLAAALGVALREAWIASHELYKGTNLMSAPMPTSAANTAQQDLSDDAEPVEVLQDVPINQSQRRRGLTRRIDDSEDDDDSDDSDVIILEVSPSQPPTQHSSLSSAVIKEPARIPTPETSGSEQPSVPRRIGSQSHKPTSAPVVRIGAPSTNHTAPIGSTAPSQRSRNSASRQSNASALPHRTTPSRDAAPADVSTARPSASRDGAIARPHTISNPRQLLRAAELPTNASRGKSTHQSPHKAPLGAITSKFALDGVADDEGHAALEGLIDEGDWTRLFATPKRTAPRIRRF